LIPAIQYQVGGSLVFEVPEDGTVTTPFVAVLNPRGEEVQAEEAATVDNVRRTLTTQISAGEAGELFQPHGATPDIYGRRAPADGAVHYQARWRYTIDGVEYRRLQLFEVRRHVAWCPLNQLKLETYDYLIASRDRPDQPEGYARQIKLAWERDVLDAIRSRGRNPHLVRDVDQLEAAAAFYALGRIYGSWGARYRDQAAEWSAQGAAALEQCFGNLTWYDLDENGVEGGSEVGRPFAPIRATR
jgi:hypothetical protein